MNLPSPEVPVDPGALANVRRVLVVDDDVRVTVALSALLSDFEIEVETCSGPTLSAMLVSFAPELVLLDIKLELTDAFTLIRTQIPSDFRGVVSVMSGLGLEAITDVMLFGERRGLSIGPPLLKPISQSDVHHLVEVADQLLERRSILATDKVQSTAVSGSPLRLRQALDAGMLEVWYQPKFDLSSGGLVGAEALIRGRHPDGNIATPYELLMDATREDKVDLTDFILATAEGHVATLSSIGFHKRLSFNVPVSYLLQPDPVRLIRHASTQPWWPGMIFEITEDEALSDIEHLQAITTQLKLYGVVLSIDDFGAAYSSLERLRDLRFSELKLDRSFVRGCAVDSTKGAICRSVISLGTDLGVTTVAEGVEDADDLELIVELGCNQVQGFLFAKPMPFADLCKMVETWTGGPLFSDRPLLPTATLLS